MPVKASILFLFIIITTSCSDPVTFERTVTFDPLNENYTPRPPSDINITRHTDTTLMIKWKDNSISEGGFILEKQLADAPFTEIASLDSNITTYIDTISSFGTHRYRLQSRKGSNFSNYSSAKSHFISRWKELPGEDVENSQGIFIDDNRVLFVSNDSDPMLLDLTTYSWEDLYYELKLGHTSESKLSKSEQGDIFQIVGRYYSLDVKKMSNDLRRWETVADLSYDEFTHKGGTLKTLNIQDNQLLIYLIDRGANNNKNQPLVILFNFETYEHKQISVPEDLININTLLHVGESSVFFGADSVSFFYNYQSNEWDIKTGPGESTEGFRKSIELPGNRILYLSSYKDFIFDLNTMVWRKIERLNDRKLFQAVELPNNKILGIEPDGFRVLNDKGSVLLFDPELETWERLESNKYVTYPTSGVLLKNNAVLFTGGVYAHTVAKDAAIFRLGDFEDYY